MIASTDCRTGKIDRGDGMVEFALLIPVFMLIVMGVLDLGRGVYAYSVVANSAREGARYGSVHPLDDAGMISTARASVVALDLSQLTVSVTHPSATTIRVQVNYGFRLVTPLISNVVGGGVLPLQSTATMYTGY